MGLIERLRSLAKKPSVANLVETPTFEVQYTANSIDLHLPEGHYRTLEIGNGSELPQLQYTLLHSLVEQGHATRFPNGFTLSETVVASIGPEESELLGLPEWFPGDFEETIRSHTSSRDFSFTVSPRLTDLPEPDFNVQGGTIAFRRHRYRLHPPVLQALKAIEQHQALPVIQRTTAANVRLVASLQAAKQDFEELRDQHQRAFGTSLGTWPISMGHFDRFETSVPDKVRLSAEPNEDGSLTLRPDLGVGTDPAELDEYWVQVDRHQDEGVLRHGDQLVVLNERVLAGVLEIRKNRHMPKEKVSHFLQAPGEVLDLEHTDIELSFNVRVKGVGVIAPMTFADASDNGIQWIEKIDTEEVLKPESLRDFVVDHESLAAAENAIEIARDAQSPVAVIEEHRIDVTDPDQVHRALSRARDAVYAAEASTTPSTSSSVQVGMVVDEVESVHDKLQRMLEEHGVSQDLDYSTVTRQPFPHQLDGISWLVSRMLASCAAPIESPDRIQGAILADDMGLGKTFMALVALKQFVKVQQRKQGTALPTLAVLPLSLIENWEDEIRDTFSQSPFDDVVVLQSQRDLTRFRLANHGRETIASSDRIDDEGFLDEESIKLSLRVGEKFGDSRLDMPNRLVLITYETLASFQLSLAQINWGAVIFDEAQALKNPNALRTRAAKGLKAHFKLLATGTPVENSLRDFWCLMDTAQPGLLETWPEFRKHWVPNNGETDSIKLEKGLALAEHVRPFMLRRTKEEHLPNLPSKTIYSGYPQSGSEVFNELLRQPMSSRQQQSYDQELAQHEIRKRNSQGAALATIQALRNVSLHADALGTRILNPAVTSEDSARLQATFAILDKVKEAHEKAIIFVINKNFQIRLAGWLRERYGLMVDIINGDTQAMGAGNSGTRKGLIRKFESRNGFNLIIMSPLAVGTGLTVTGANHAIHLERHWNPAKEAQATDRIYRIGQTKSVHVYLPLALHPNLTSFDENLDQLLRNKVFVKDALMAPSEVTHAELEVALGI